MTSLSVRERQVVDLVVDGILNKQIASRLGISIKTVELHRANAMQKTGAASFAQLVRLITEYERLRDDEP
jgi:FixJ family two-component response regulator